MSKISSVSISLKAGQTPITNFSGIVFADAHNYFRERVRTYSDIDGVGEDFPTTSRAYIAAQQAFGADVPPAEFKIGRRVCDTQITPTGVEDAQVYNVTITVTGGDSVVASYTAGALDDEEAVVDGLLADITGDVDVAAHVTAAKVGTGSSAVLTITATTAADDFNISVVSSNLDVDFINDTESAADLLQEIRDEDDNFYFITAYDKSEAFVLAMDLAATSAGKFYKVSVADQNTLTVLAQPAVDTAGKLKEVGNNYTWCEFHQDAATKFPEIRSLIEFANSNGGDFVPAPNYITGVVASQDPTTGKYLTTTQEGYLESRNCNYYDFFNERTIYNGRMGKMVGGEWADVIRNRDILEAELQNALDQFMLVSRIIPFTQKGISQIDTIVETVLRRRATTLETNNILAQDVPYEMSRVDVSAIPLAQKQARVFTRSITLYLAGAIQLPSITATLTYNQDV